MAPVSARPDLALRVDATGAAEPLAPASASASKAGRWASGHTAGCCSAPGCGPHFWECHLERHVGLCIQHGWAPSWRQLTQDAPPCCPPPPPWGAHGSLSLPLFSFSLGLYQALIVGCRMVGRSESFSSTASAGSKSSAHSHSSSFTNPHRCRPGPSCLRHCHVDSTHSAARLRA